MALGHNAPETGTFTRFETCGINSNGPEMYSPAAIKAEKHMIEIVSRWGNSTLLVTFLLITYAVVITLR